MLSRYLHRASRLNSKRTLQTRHTLGKGNNVGCERLARDEIINITHVLRMWSSVSQNVVDSVSIQRNGGVELGKINGYSNTTGGTPMLRSFGSIATIDENEESYVVPNDMSFASDEFRRTMNSAYRCAGIRNCHALSPDSSHASTRSLSMKYRSFSTNSPPTTPPVKKSESTDKTNMNPSKSLVQKESAGDKVQGGIQGAISSFVSILEKTPGVLWFYLTNPKEFKEKMLELKEHAKKEAHHYYMGSKLLIADLRTAKAMMGRTLQGSSLTRRERKQLLRTVTDVFRLVPMSVFVLIPFMELALPLALKLFPNMLPSTFQDSLKAEETMKRELKSRLAMAEFFQETLQDLAKEQKKKAENRKMKIKEGDGSSSELESTETRAETAASFLEFIGKARKGQMFPPEVIIRYAKYFEDDLTLDNMPRMQLINMCKYMAIPPYGNDNLLRFQLRHKIRTLQEDDQRILWEGIDSLTKMELREACQDRGMRSTGLSKQAYKRALQQWIDLSVNRHVPISLLIMSRTFFLQQEMSSRSPPDADGSKSVAGIADAISGLDKEVVNEVILGVASPEEKRSDPALMQLKLEVLEQQNELIEEEKQQREFEAAREKAEKEKIEKELDEKEKSEIEEFESPGVVKNDGTGVTAHDDHIKQKDIKTTRLINDLKKESETIGEGEEEVKLSLPSEEEEEKTLSTEEIDAISQLVSPDPVSAERETLQRIKAAMQDDSDSVQDIDGEMLLGSSEQEKKNSLGQKVSAPMDSISVDDADKIAIDIIKSSERQAEEEAEKSTKISLEGVTSLDLESDSKETGVDKSEDEYTDEKLDKTISRLKTKVERMVGNIEIQLSDVEAKIGDKMHFLDKDMDGILSRGEMVICLQSVLKRPLSNEEAMAIAADMDENEDGFFSVEELSKWLETNKLVKLVEEGRDSEVDKIIATQASKMKEQDEESDGTIQSKTSISQNELEKERT